MIFIMSIFAHEDDHLHQYFDYILAVLILLIPFAIIFFGLYIE